VFHAFLRFLQDQEFEVPHALFRIPGLKPADSLPRFLTDEQVRLLRDEIEAGVARAATPAQQRDALMDRAAFYLLWHGGLRLGELEELKLEDLDLPNRKLMVRKGKGQRDRAVYLTDTAVAAVRAYLPQRGMGPTDHLFLYRNELLSKDLVRGRIHAAGGTLSHFLLERFGPGGLVRHEAGVGRLFVHIGAQNDLADWYMSLGVNLEATL
jgi:integrase